jgi:hypothetical protein
MYYKCTLFVYNVYICKVYIYKYSVLDMFLSVSGMYR